jgi:hypothetical protein
VPHLIAADAAFYSSKNEAAAKAKGVKRVCIPNRSTKSPEREREQKKRWFRNGQKCRTGCEGRISVAKRRHGLHFPNKRSIVPRVGIPVMDGSEVNRVREALGEAMGREVSQLDFGVLLGLNLASVEVSKWPTGARIHSEILSFTLTS